MKKTNGIDMDRMHMDFFQRLAGALTVQFGPNCCVAVYDLSTTDASKCTAILENGQVTGLRTDQGPDPETMQILLKMQREDEDRLGFMTRTADGRIIKTSLICLHDEQGSVANILEISYDISMILAVEDILHSIASKSPESTQSSDLSSIHVNHLLDDLIDQSIRLVGRPVAMMSREDKMKALRYLDERGALLITKAGPRICECFGVSKFTLYSYLDEIRSS